MHRVTSDRRIRWYAGGEAEHLPAVVKRYGYREDATEAEKEAARARILADNQAVEKLLEEKGFVMTDQAHPSAQVSRYFQTRPDADDDSRRPGAGTLVASTATGGQPYRRRKRR